VQRGVDSLQMMEKGPALDPWQSMCCHAAPQILEFSAAGDLVASWEPKDAKGFDWPVNPSGIAVDDKGNVWIGSGLPTPSPTASPSSASRCSTRTPAPSKAAGAPTARSRPTPIRAVRSERRAGEAVPHAELREAVEGRQGDADRHEG